MFIKRLKVNNFKSFKKLDVELGKFNVLIGANASGKSNFVNIFRFFKDIAESGLEDAVSLQSGFEYIKNTINTTYKNVDFEFTIIHPEDYKFWEYNNNELIANKSVYKFGLKKSRNKIIINRDEIIHYISGKIQNKKIKEEFELKIINDFGQLKFTGNLLGKLDKVKEFLNKFTRDSNIGNYFSLKKPLLLEVNFFNFIFPVMQINDRFGIYDFDPKLAKKASQITGKSDLVEDGENLSLVLKRILSSKEGSRKLSNLISNILPFISNVHTSSLNDKSLLFYIKENFSEDQSFPATLVSDGTINLTAMIVALYFQDNSITIIEEPERNIHPHLMSKVVEMMKDASSKKQVIVTTHNPEIVKHAGLDNLLLVSRDKNGFSTVTRPSEKKQVQTFLENDLGIDELYIQNLLEVL